MDLGARSCRLALLLFFAVFAGTSAASAATYKYSSYNNQIDGELNGQFVSIKTPRSVTGVAGQVQLSGSGPNSGQNLLVFCLDIYDNLQSSGTYTMSQLAPSKTLSQTQIGEIGSLILNGDKAISAVSYTHLRAHETGRKLVCR